MASADRQGIGLALAGGGPLGAIWEIGALVALSEALEGCDLLDCKVYVGVSAGGFIAAGLANGISPRRMHELFIETEEVDHPFDPDLLMHPNLREFLGRIATVPELLAGAAVQYVEPPRFQGLFESLQRLAHALPTGIFDNTRIDGWLRELFSKPGRTNDFRQLQRRLLLVATDLDTCETVSFGGPGWQDVPISLAVQASAALPGLFPPVHIRGRYFADGALTKTLHASGALKAGAKLVLCINPLVPFNADLTAQEHRRRPPPLVERGLPAVMSQTFRAMIHSRMLVGVRRYEREFPDADLILLEPGRGDVDMFFTNVFSYSARRRLSEHAYQVTRSQLLARADELRPVLARHGIRLDEEVLRDPKRRLNHRHRARPPAGGRQEPSLKHVTDRLDLALDGLAAVLEAARPPATAKAPATEGGRRMAGR